MPDRLRKSLRVADLGVQEMADYLEVERNTISRWINGRTNPPAAALRLWAMRTGVNYAWIRNGETPTADGDGGLSVRPKGFEPPTFWFGVGPILTSLDEEEDEARRGQCVICSGDCDPGDCVMYRDAWELTA